MAQPPITKTGPLLDSQGKLVEAGWARRPLRDYDPSRARRLRLKEWDYLGIYSGDRFITIMIAHLGYLAVGALQVIDLTSKRKVIEKTTASPLGIGCSMSRSSLSGRSILRSPTCRIEFVHGPKGRDVTARWLGTELQLHVDPLPEGHDSIVMQTPIGDRGFYYNHKVSGLPVRGTIMHGKQRMELDSSSLGTLDWGRGVWARDTFWNWATGCGHLKDGRSIRLNLGCGFGDLSHGTENCFFVEGRIAKLDGVAFDYDPLRLDSPWHFQSDDRSLDLELRPLYVNTKRTNLLIASSTLYQVFGVFSGRLRQGEKEIRVEGIRGWAEEHHARW